MIDDIKSSPALLRKLELKTVSNEFYLKNFTTSKLPANTTSREIRLLGEAFTRLFKTEKYLNVKETELQGIGVDPETIWKQWEVVKPHQNLQPVQLPQFQYNDLQKQLKDQGNFIAKLIQTITELSKSKENKFKEIKNKVMENFSPKTSTKKVDNTKQSNENTLIVKKRKNKKDMD